jgi:hypothetical protein
MVDFEDFMRQLLEKGTAHSSGRIPTLLRWDLKETPITASLPLRRFIVCVPKQKDAKPAPCLDIGKTLQGRSVSMNIFNRGG